MKFGSDDCPEIRLRESKLNKVSEKESMNSFKHVRLGITFVYIGLVLAVLAIFVIPLTMVTRFPPLVLAAIPLTIASSLFSMVGRILCLTVPRQVKAHGFIVTSVVFDLLAIISALSSVIPGVPNWSGFSSLLYNTAVIFFLIFLKKLAVYINDDTSSVRASNMFNLAIGIVVVMVAKFFVPPIAFLVLLFVIIGFFIYNRLLWGLRKSLSPIAAPALSISVACQPNDIR